MTHRGPFQPLLFCDSVTRQQFFGVAVPARSLPGTSSASWGNSVSWRSSAILTTGIFIFFPNTTGLRVVQIQRQLKDTLSVHVSDIFVLCAGVRDVGGADFVRRSY